MNEASEDAQKLGQLTGDELGALAKRLIRAKTKKDADAITELLVRGFYGKEMPKKPTAARRRRPPHR